MRLQTLAILAGTLTVCLAMAATASAQYGSGGTMGGSGTGSGATGSGMSHYTYGSGKAVGIGVGVAAGAAGVALLIHHRHKVKSEASLIGCTQPTSSGLSLRNDEDGQTYMLVSNGENVQPGERVELKGALKNDLGTNAFRIRNVVTDFGACNTTADSTHNAELEQLAVAVK